MIPKGPRARRSAFTLMELLVVITIIGVLAALILAAINYASTSTTEVANRNDIMGMSAAVNTFKQRFGIYPPSQIKLCMLASQYGNTPLDQASLQCLTTMFPKLGWSGAAPTQIVWNLTSTSLFPKTGIILEGDQCLVFFLGGLQQHIAARQPAACLGFSPNPQDPTNFTKAGGGRLDSIGPFFKFEGSRLTPRLSANELQTFMQNPGVGNAPQPWGCDVSSGNPVSSHGRVAAQHFFYSYLDNYGFKPYVYFSSGGRKNGYKTTDCFWTGNWTASFTPSPVGDQYLVGPVYTSVTGVGANALISYPNPDSFQILSAGKDGVYGMGVAPFAAGVGANAWSPATAPSYEASRQQIDAVANPNAPGGNGQDDMANFYGSQLKVAQ